MLIARTYCLPVFIFDSVCHCGAFLVRQYVSFSFIVSVIVKALIDKIVVGTCCFNLALI